MRHGKRQVRTSLFILALCFTFAAISGATKKPPPKPININAANSEELQQVPGIGPATAEKILQMRKSYGSFKSVDDLLSIKGIGKKTPGKNAQVSNSQQIRSRQQSASISGLAHSSEKTGHVGFSFATGRSRRTAAVAQALLPVPA
jgi:competence ComEA-like helix-hairpin-helix protein